MQYILSMSIPNHSSQLHVSFSCFIHKHACKVVYRSHVYTSVIPYDYSRAEKSLLFSDVSLIDMQELTITHICREAVVYKQS